MSAGKFEPFCSAFRNQGKCAENRARLHETEMLLEQQRLASRRIQTIMACLLADEDICRCWSRQLRLNCTLMMLREKFDSLGRLSRSMEGDGASSFSFNSLPASNEAKGTPHALPTRERQKF